MSQIVNYDHIRESLTLILEESSELDSDEVAWVLDSLDDAVSNNTNSLVMWEDIPYEVEQTYR